MFFLYIQITVFECDVRLHKMGKFEQLLRTTDIGTHVDPRILVERIENGREIPGLRDSLVQIMQDYRLQVSIYHSLCHIIGS